MTGFFSRELSEKLGELGCVATMGHMWADVPSCCYNDSCSKEKVIPDGKIQNFMTEFGAQFEPVSALHPWDFLQNTEQGRENCKKRWGNATRMVEMFNDYSEWPEWELNKIYMIFEPDAEAFMWEGLR